jgi:hypothetical protein
MSASRVTKKSPNKKRLAPKKRRLGLSKLGLIEVVPREIADAEIAKLFEDSKLFPDEEE